MTLKSLALTVTLQLLLVAFVELSSILNCKSVDVRIVHLSLVKSSCHSVCHEHRDAPFDQEGYSAHVEQLESSEVVYACHKG